MFSKKSLGVDIALLIMIYLLAGCRAESVELSAETVTEALSTASNTTEVIITPEQRSTVTWEANSTQTIVPTSLPQSQVIDVAQPVGEVAFLYNNSLWLLDSAATNVQRIPLSSEDMQLARTLIWSPDHSKLAWLGVSAVEIDAARVERRNIEVAYPVVADLADGNLQRFLNVKAAPRSGVAWNIDSASLFFKPSGSEALLQNDIYQLDIVPDTTESLIEIDADNMNVLITGDLILTSTGQLLVPSILSNSPTWQSGIPTIVAVDLDQRTTSRYLDLSENNIDYGDLTNTHAGNVLELPIGISPQKDMIAYSPGRLIDPRDQHPELQGLYLLDLYGGTPERVIDAMGLEEPVWSTDGSMIAVSGAIGDGTLLYFYDVVAQQTNEMNSQQWEQIQSLVNPDQYNLNVLRLYPITWLDRTRVLIKAWFVSAEQNLVGESLLSFDIESGSIEVPGWAQQ